MMIKRKLLTVCSVVNLLCSVISCSPSLNLDQSQQQYRASLNDTTYFDAEWHQVEKSSIVAEYYRAYEKVADDLFVNDYYLSNNQLRCRGKVFSLLPLQFHGMVLSYHENGELLKKAIYQSGKIIGDEIVYYKNGTPKEHFKYEGNDRFIIQMWDIAGNELLSEGNGTVDREGENNILIEHMVIKNHEYEEFYTIRKIEKDTIYAHVDQPAEYSRGITQFYQKLATEMQYPAHARKNGIQGRVYVQFLITKDGQLTEPKVIRGIGGGCDEEAIRAINTIKGWEPAIHKGKPVTIRTVLPVIFKLS